MQSEDYFSLRSQADELTHTHQLARIPLVVYAQRKRPFAAAALHHGMPEKCLVCYKDFSDEQPLRLLPKCNHMFHKTCVDRLLKHTRYKCPLCGRHAFFGVAAFRRNHNRFNWEELSWEMEGA